MFTQQEADSKTALYCTHIPVESMQVEVHILVVEDTRLLQFCGFTEMHSRSIVAFNLMNINIQVHEQIVMYYFFLNVSISCVSQHNIGSILYS